MIRLRFEKASQIFENNASAIILPLDEITEELAKEYSRKLYAEIPAMIWEGELDSVRKALDKIKSWGVYDVVAENIGAISLAKEFGFNIHGGSTLNILNSTSLSEYEELGLCDATLSFELAFSKMRKIKGNIPFGFIGYGYMSVMKLRSCPARGERGCASCDGHPVLTDRMGEQFQIICHNKKYSDMLNCVPTYVADKTAPDVDFQTLFFTIETKEEAEEIYRLYKSKETPLFRRTAGLYFRELQ